MKIWLVNNSERLSFDADNGRRMRMGLLCSHLAESDTQVTYWSSAFNHVQKVKLANRTVTEQRGPVQLIRLRALGYKKHYSLARFLDHAFVAREFAKQARNHALPDLIICSYPTIEIAHAATRFGAKSGVPVILDVRDMWPDLFHWVLPARAQALARTALAPYDRVAQAALRRATTLTSVTDGFLDWALDKAGRKRRHHERPINFCYEPASYSSNAMDEVDQFWRNLGLNDDVRRVVLFIGSFVRSFDLRPVIQAAASWGEDPAAPVFALCGSGDREALYREEAKGISNVLMPGWLNDGQLRWILERADVAISPLADRLDYRSTINNKFVEYLSGGVPILVSPKNSYCASLVEEHDCGEGFNLNKPETLADRLRRLFADEDRLARWHRNAHQLFERRFVAEKVMREWDDLIEATLDTARSRDPVHA